MVEIWCLNVDIKHFFASQLFSPNCDNSGEASSEVQCMSSWAVLCPPPFCIGGVLNGMDIRWFTNRVLLHILFSREDTGVENSAVNVCNKW